MEQAEEIWNLLHDGGIAGVRETIPDDVTLRIEIDYLTRRMNPPCEAIELTLLGCDAFEYLDWTDDQRTPDLQVLARVEPEILSAATIHYGVRVICSNGQFDIRYSCVRVARSDGTASS